MRILWMETSELKSAATLSTRYHTKFVGTFKWDQCGSTGYKTTGGQSWPEVSKRNPKSLLYFTMFVRQTNMFFIFLFWPPTLTPAVFQPPWVTRIPSISFESLTNLKYVVKSIAKENSKDRLPLVRNDHFFTSSHGVDKKSKTSLILSSKHSVSNC